MEVTIGQFAKLMDTTVRTLRYYDKMELLSPKKFNEYGQKVYTRVEWERYQQITIYKHLGLSLKEMKEQMTNGDVTNRELLLVQKAFMEKKQEEISETLDVIARMERLYKIEGQSEEVLDEFAFIMMDLFRREKRQVKVLEEHFQSGQLLTEQLRIMKDPELQAKMDREVWRLLQAIRKAVRHPDDVHQENVQDILKDMHRLFPNNKQFFTIVENEDFLANYNRDFNSYFPEDLADYMYKEMKEYYEAVNNSCPHKQVIEPRASIDDKFGTCGV
ncbi:MerR family transcriptional regulator [Geomicrobium sp. JCM 19037]|uniref:MerR family transcriptional regulator n=1 Tax=Geomicrobium sp. JCM 19037 TaxID=1460634 RepID=UPI0009DE3566|nr:MerR family transcriptional regulator [Geomicrobium sp. JCM 19037]